MCCFQDVSGCYQETVFPHPAVYDVDLPTASSVTQTQWPRGMAEASARWLQVCSTRARV